MEPGRGKGFLLKKFVPAVDEDFHTGTRDKGPNTHWVHGEKIEITVNM